MVFGLCLAITYESYWTNSCTFPLPFLFPILGLCPIFADDLKWLHSGFLGEQIWHREKARVRHHLTFWEHNIFFMLSSSSWIVKIFHFMRPWTSSRFVWIRLFQNTIQKLQTIPLFASNPEQKWGSFPLQLQYSLFIPSKFWHSAMSILTTYVMRLLLPLLPNLQPQHN